MTPGGRAATPGVPSADRAGTGPRTACRPDRPLRLRERPARRASPAAPLTAQPTLPGVRTVLRRRLLGRIWRRLSGDEKKLFDTVARSYLASVMPDYRYRQTIVALDVRGFEFRATGRQPIERGWRDAFPEWRPAEEKGEAAQVLPALRDREVARLRDPKIEDKETQPPPRYKEGTLIEAMQNAWRFVEDDILRDRLKEAKGIGTPATRAEIIAGLRKQGFPASGETEHRADRAGACTVRGS